MIYEEVKLKKHLLFMNPGDMTKQDLESALEICILTKKLFEESQDRNNARMELILKHLRLKKFKVITH